ncbi:unnamed protein product [Pleuronectes platessa]|uniref:Secreted protein n=1 Tax=Pleuronectes platessa TaxID=8262 RepID=A0A9N7UTH1_PLEPL|nr:unnamed protein product [Pleuronectes platessa]
MGHLSAWNHHMTLCLSSWLWRSDLGGVKIAREAGAEREGRKGAWKTVLTICRLASMGASDLSAGSCLCTRCPTVPCGVGKFKPGGGGSVAPIACKSFLFPVAHGFSSDT